MGVSVGLIGAGPWARAHLRAYVHSPQVTEVHLAERSSAARKALEGEYGIIKRSCGDYHDLLKDESLTIVDVCGAVGARPAAVTAALQAGKHVIVETPLAPTVGQADELLAAAKRAGGRLCPVLRARFYPAVMAAREIIRSGQIGRPVLGVCQVVANAGDLEPDPGGGGDKEAMGPLLEAIHQELDVLQHLLGRAQAVSGRIRSVGDKGRGAGEDTCVLAPEFPDGVLGSITVTYAAAPGQPLISRQIIGTDGTLLISDDPPDETPLSALVDGDMQPVKVHAPPNIAAYGTRRAIDHIVGCLLAEETPRVDALEARGSLAALAAAQRSEREGTRVEVQQRKQ